MCDVLLLRCAPSVALMFKYVLCILLESNIPPFFVHFILEGRKVFFNCEIKSVVINSYAFITNCQASSYKCVCLYECVL